VLASAKIWSRVPEGLNAKTDSLTDLLTDGQLQSNWDSDFVTVHSTSQITVVIRAEEVTL